jgi:pimeloyl-ACP methyl ester carboxylesterase
MSEADLNKKFAVNIFKPEGTPTSITVFLPGTMLNLEEYSSTYDVLTEQNQVVIGFRKLNPFTQNHDRMAEKVAAVVKDFRAIEGNSSLPEKYNIVGHSLGGKLALMVAAKFDIDNVNKIIALDPVDDKPRELTTPKEEDRTNLGDSQAQEIHLFQSEKGGDKVLFIGPALCPPDRNASVIQEMYPDQITSFQIDEGAGHMSYKDTEKDDASVLARTSVQNKIREVIS